ncbi:hypothetical protein AAHC03_09376 [Spirometra sp. Aus1]
MSVLDALKNGHSKHLTNGVAETNDLNKVDSRGYTAIHWACHYRRLTEMKKLLDAGAMLSHPNKDGNTALHLAAQVGFVEGAEELLLRGADPEAIDLSGCTPLIQACQKKQEAEGYTALHYAIINGLDSSVSLLLSKGADANAVGRNGYRAAHIAAARGRVSALRLLLNHGADCTSRNWLGYTPLHLSAARGYEGTTKLLLDTIGDVNCRDYVGSTPLLLACQHNKEKVAKLLLEHGAQIELTNKHGKTALQAATANGSVNLVQLLLQHGANVDRADNYGTTPLHIASKLQNDELTYLLLNFGASVYTKQERGRTPYEMYVSSGRGYFLSPSPVYNQSPTFSNGYLSPASAASSPQPYTSSDVMARLRSNSASRSLSRCNQLLFRRKRELSGPNFLRDAGSHPSVPPYTSPSSGNSVNSLPPTWQPQRQHTGPHSPRKASPPQRPNCLPPQKIPGRRLRPDIFQRFGVDQFSGLDDSGTASLSQTQPPLSLCEEMKQTGTVSEILQQHSQSLQTSQPKYIKEIVTRTGVHVFYEQGSLRGSALPCDASVVAAVRMGDLKASKEALRNGGNVNAQDGNGNTLLHLACDSTNLAMVELLLSYDADPNLKEETLEDTPLHIAARKRDLKILQALIRHNADVNARNFNGETALHCAVRKDGEAAMRLLLDAGVDVNARDTDGATALHLAVSLGSLYAVKLLLLRKADPDRREKNGRTPLRRACEQGQSIVLQSLIEAGAEVDETDWHDRTLLHVTAADGNADISKQLIEFGCPVDAQDDQLLTPLHMACLKGHIKTAELLIESGASLHLRDARGRTIEDCAEESGNIPLLLFIQSMLEVQSEESTNSDDSSSG